MENGRTKGFKITISSLDSKLEELKKNLQNEKENLRGFSQGGSSIASDDQKDLAAQIAMIKELESVAKAKENFNQLEDQNKKEQLEQEKKQQKNQEIFEIISEEEANKKAKIIVEFCRENGLECSISQTKSGDLEVKINQKSPSTSPANPEGSLFGAKKEQERE
jgi:hypothetical protein